MTSLCPGEFWHAAKSDLMLAPMLSRSLFLMVAVVALLVSLVSLVSLGSSAAAQDCAACHAAEVALWQQSHHAKAMALPSANSMLGDFSADTFVHKSLRADFSQKQNDYQVRLTQNGESADWLVQYAFGAYPLQQYLAQQPDGRLQVLPVAWDSRSSQQGGQRWISVYPEEDLQPADRLHWQQPLQSWNGMCADCHSSGFVRRYNAATNTYSSRYSEVNVGCASCHAVPRDHGRDAEAGQQESSYKPSAFWHRAGDASTAQRSEPLAANVMDGCFACHSLRTPLVDGITPGQNYLDQFTPSLIEQPLYFADGQVREEVYVYGSFLQSKMYARGVQCQDCHEPHSQQLRLAGDALCGQCHALNEFAGKQHTLHAATSAGARCVNCHMPSTTYMQVDSRRDHSFSIPRPGVSAALGAPDACTRCHQDKDATWAVRALDKAHPQRRPPSTNASAMHASLQGKPLHPAKIQSLLADTELPAIQRASVLMNQIGPNSAVATRAQWQPPAALFQGTEPLLTLAAIRGADVIPAARRVQLLVPLLAHNLRAIRVAATEALLGTEVPASAMANLHNGFAELTVALQQIAWRGEGAMRAATVALRGGEGTAKAEAELQRGITIEPYFVPAYVNLADMYRQRGAIPEQARLYERALTHNPQAAVLHHAQALFYVRQQDYARAAVSSKNAVTYGPTNPGFATAYVLIAERRGEPQAALRWLLEKLPAYGFNPSLAQLGYSVATKLGDTAMITAFAQHTAQ